MNVFWFGGFIGIWCVISWAWNRSERRKRREQAVRGERRERDLMAVVEATRETGAHRLGATQSRDQRVVVAVITDAEYSRIELGVWPPLLHKETQ